MWSMVRAVLSPLFMLRTLAFEQHVAWQSGVQLVEAECTDFLNMINPNSPRHACPARDNGTCPNSCDKTILTAFKCVGKSLDEASSADADLSVIGFDKASTTFDLTVFLPMLAKSFLGRKSSLYNCTVLKDPPYDLGKLLQESNSDDTGCKTALQAFHVSRLSVCDLGENSVACHPQCEQIIKAAGVRCNNISDEISEETFQARLLHVAPAACQCALREHIFRDTSTCAAMNADAGHAPFASIGYLGVLLLLGLLIRNTVTCIKSIHMPAGLIGGFLGLMIRNLAHWADPSFGKWLNDAWMSQWENFGNYLINIIFATIFVGSDMLSVKEMWVEGGPQLAYAQIHFMAQHVIGFGLSMLLAASGFLIPDFYGYNLPMTFVGGHGNCFAIKKAYDKLDWKQGVDTCLVVASTSLVGAVLVGVAAVNLARAFGLLSSTGTEPEASRSNVRADSVTSCPTDLSQDIIPIKSRQPAAFTVSKSEAIDTMGLQGAIVFMIVFVAYSISRTLLSLELASLAGANALRESGVPVLPNILAVFGNLGLSEYFPFFTMNLLVGMLMTSILKRLGLAYIIDRSSFDRIAGLSLDALLVAAIATTDVAGAFGSIVPLLSIILSGFAFNLFMLFVVSPRFFLDCSYQRAFFEFGTNTATTPIGLLLLQMADANTPASVQRSISIALMIACPLIGIYMAIVMALLTKVGTNSAFFLSLFLLCFWITLWCKYFQPAKLAAELQAGQVGRESLTAPLTTSFSMCGNVPENVASARAAEHGLVRAQTSTKSSGAVQMGVLDPSL